MTELPDEVIAFRDSILARSEAGKRLLLQELFQTLQRLRDVQQQLNGESLTVTSERSKMTRANPLLSAEILLRKQFAALAKLTGLRNYTLPRLPGATR